MVRVPVVCIVVLLAGLSVGGFMGPTADAFHGEYACSDHKPAGVSEHEAAYCTITFAPGAYEWVHVEIQLEESLVPLEDVRMSVYLNGFEEVCVGNNHCHAKVPWPDWGSNGGGYPVHQWCAGFAVHSTEYSGHEELTQIPFGYQLDCWAE